MAAAVDSLESRLSSSGTLAYLRQGMWDPVGPVIELVSLAYCRAESLPPDNQGSPVTLLIL